MNRRHLLPATLTFAMLSACQSQQPAPFLAVKQSASESLNVVTAANTIESSPRSSLISISGQAMFGEAPLANAQVAAKDALTGKVLAGASSDASGTFTLELPSTDGNLVQVIATKGDNTLQAFMVASAPDAQAKYTLAAVSASVRVDWGTTLVAQLLGAKLAEVFVADSPAGGRGREVVARAQELAKTMSQTKVSSLEQLRRESLANPEVRKEVVTIATEANEKVLTAFREGKGEVFEVSPLSVPDVALDLPAPAVTIDRAAGKVTLTIGGKTETLNVPRQALEGKGKVVIALAATLAKSPSTGLVIPSQAELEQAMASRPSSSSRGGASGGSGSSGSGSSGGGYPHAPSHGDEYDRDAEPQDPKRKMWITDVQFADSGQSLKGANSPAALAFDPEGRPVRLKLKGKLNAEHPSKLDPKDFELKGFPFDGLLQQTFVGKDPKRRVLLDDSIWLPLDPSVKPTDTELTVILNTKALTDLAISTLHEISVIDREDVATAAIKVANTTPISGVQPVITKIEVVGKINFESSKGKKFDEHDKDNNGKQNGNDEKAKDFRIFHNNEQDDDINDDDEDEVKYLKVEGYNLPVSIYSHWAELNGQRVYAHATWVFNEYRPKTILYLHIPDDQALKSVGQNQLIYASPLGFGFKRF